MITCVDQFMLGLNIFKSSFTQSLQASNTSGEALFFIPDHLHCHKKLLVYVGNGLIEKGIMLQKLVNGTREKITGQTLLQIAKTVLCKCKK